MENEVNWLLKILNASPGFGLPMTQEEAIHFLSTQKRNMYIGTVDKKNESNIHPTWYFVNVENKKIYVETAKKLKKIAKYVK